MEKKRIRHSADCKATVALEAVKGVKTVHELAGHDQVHPTQISPWKRQVQEGARALFGTARAKGAQGHEAVQATLYEDVGRVNMELDWIKKPAGLSGRHTSVDCAQPPAGEYATAMRTAGPRSSELVRPAR